MLPFHRIAAATLAVALFVAAPAAAQTKLRFKFKEGETLKYRTEQKMKMSTSILGKDIDMNMNQTAEMSWKVLSVDTDGAAKVQISFGRTKLTMDTPMGQVQVDSKDNQEPADPLGKIMFSVVKAMSDMTAEGKLNSRGEFSELKLPKDLAAKLQNLPGAAAMGDMFSPEGLQRMMSQSGLVVPEKSVARGDSWKQKTDLKLPIGKIVVDVVYTYDGTVNGLEKIALKPKMTIQPDPNAPFTMTLKAQEAGGQALFDNAAGRLREVSMTQAMTMEIETMGQTLTQRLSQSVTTKLLD